MIYEAIDPERNPSPMWLFCEGCVSVNQVPDHLELTELHMPFSALAHREDVRCHACGVLLLERSKPEEIQAQEDDAMTAQEVLEMIQSPDLRKELARIFEQMLEGGGREIRITRSALEGILELDRKTSSQ